jgi:hypothetical protein
MNTAATADEVLLQPETREEERLLDRLFSHAEPPRCWWDYDIPEYDGLDSMLAYRAAESDPPEAGARALVIDVVVMEDLAR